MFKFNLKKFGLGIAIIIVFNLFINYGIDTFYKSPEYDNFCKPETVRQTITSREKCEGVGGLWSENAYYKGAMKDGEQIATAPVPIVQINEPTGWCDAYFKCQKDFEITNNGYKRNAFVIWVVAGLAAIVVSFFLLAVEAMSTAFVFAGIVSLIVGTIGYWSAMQDYLRFVILGLVLAVLIYIGYKKLKE